MPTPLPAGPSPFVGRRNELALVRERLSAARQGQGQVVLVSGEAGIGKTRLLAELAEQADAGGWLVLAGRAYDSEGMPPYLPIVEALREYVRRAPLEHLSVLLGPGAPDVAVLLPDMRHRLPDIPAPPAFPPEEQRYRLFESISDFVLAIAQSVQTGGLLLLCDDLHWADPPTLHLLRHLVRRPIAAPLLVAGAYRTLDPAQPPALRDLLAELSRDDRCERIALSALGPTDTAELIAGLIARPAAPAVVEAVHRETEGNPFFLREVVRQLRAEGRDLTDPTAAVAGWGIPAGVRDVLDRRLARLSPAAREVLQAAAVVGDGWSHELLGAMTGLEGPALVEPLEEATDAGMLRTEGVRYHVSHALIRRTLYDGLSVPRRQQLHARAAAAIERVHVHHLEPHLTALAAHSRLAGPAVDGETAIGYALQAGEAAARVFAYEEALGHWQAALALLEAAGAAADRLAELLVRLADLIRLTGIEPAQGLAYLERALRLYEALDLEREAAVVHLRLGSYRSLYELMDIARAREHFQAAEAVLGREAESVALWEVYQSLAYVAHALMRTEEGLAASRRGMQVAEHLRDQPLWARAAVLHGRHLLAVGQVATGLALMDEAWALADRLDHPAAAFGTGWVRVQWANLLRAPREAQRWQGELAKPRVARAPRQRYWLSVDLSLACGLAGDLAEARRLLAGITPTPGQLWVSHVEGWLLYWAGDWEQAQRRYAEAYDDARRSGNVFLVTWMGDMLAQAWATLGEPARAEALWQEGLAIASAGPNLHRELVNRAALALLCADTGRLGEAAPHLLRCQEILAGGEDWRGVAVQAGLAAAVVAAAQGALDAAEEQMTGVLARSRTLGLVWDEAEALHRWGRALLDAGQRERALEQLNAALALYRRHGAGERWQAGVLADLRLAEREGSDSHQPLPGYPAGLSAREVEVLRLLAAGKTNRQIADALVISLNTVTRHITHIFAKTGTRNRAEAAAYASSQGLTV